MSGDGQQKTPSFETGSNDVVPRDRRRRNPLMDEAGWRTFCRIRDLPSAPCWNYQVGDRLLLDDLPAVDAWRGRLAEGVQVSTDDHPPAWLLGRLSNWMRSVPQIRDAIPAGFNLCRDWRHLPTLSRSEIALHIDRLVPLDASLERLIVYETSGTTTGHALDVPNHPRAVALNHPLLELALARNGVQLEFSVDRVACINLGSEAGTVTFPNVFAVWNNAGFAKVNLHPAVWNPDAARAFFAELQPQFLTGDPVAFARMLEWQIECRPAALVSTATRLAPALKQRLQQHYGCPVIDFYSTTETGPIACSDADESGLGLLCPDLFVEILDAEGDPVAPGETGEITVSGGRNPFLPLLRYRTGDYARLQPGQPGRLLDLESREPVELVDAAGGLVHPLDVGRVLRRQGWLQHELVQFRDLGLRLTIRPLPDQPIDLVSLRRDLDELFGGLTLEIQLDPNLGEDRPGGKVMPYRSERETA